jgi:hypothetical protein
VKKTRVRVILGAFALGWLAIENEDLPDQYREPRSFTLPLPPSTSTFTISSSSTFIRSM